MRTGDCFCYNLTPSNLSNCMRTLKNTAFAAVSKRSINYFSSFRNSNIFLSNSFILSSAKIYLAQVPQKPLGLY